MTKPTDKKVDAEDTPDMDSPEWTDYILGQLREYTECRIDRNDTRNGKPRIYPKADGLRRMVRKYIGEILGVNHELLHFSPGNYAISKCVISVNSKKGGLISYSDFAEVNTENTDEPFLPFMVATSTTRAEGRVFRKMLGLQGVVTAEEIKQSRVEEYHQERANNNRISPTKIQGLRLLVNRLSVDEFQLCLQYNKSTFDTLTEEEGSELLSALNGYQRDPSSIPAELFSPKTSDSSAKKT